MPSGKILWFGGKTKDGRVNNFGYIAMDNEKDKIRFYRRDIPLEWQEIFEQDIKFGEGYCVEFKIEEFQDKFGKKIQKAITIKLIKKIGIIAGLTKVIGEDGTFYSLKNIESDRFQTGDVVEFYLRNNKAALPCKINYEEISNDLIEKLCANCTSYKFSKNLIDYYLSRLSNRDDTENAIQFTLNKISLLETDDEILDFFNSLLLAKYQSILLISPELRQQLQRFSISDYAQFVKNLDKDTQNIVWTEVHKTIYDSEDFKVICALLKVYLENINAEKAINFILYKSKTLKKNNKKEFIDKSLEYKRLAFLDSQFLHPLLGENNLSQYIIIVQEILESKDKDKAFKKAVEATLINCLKSCSEDQKSLVWTGISSLEKKLRYKNYLWDVAPVKYKQKKITKKYEKFFKLIEEFKNSDYPFEQYITRDYKELYSSFDDNDRRLAMLWVTNDNDKEKAKMLSARGAEKLVQDFYKNLGVDV